MSKATYQGPNRRVHRVYVTKNTEYHFREDLCVAVRDLKTGRFLASHLAINRRLTGGVKFHQNGAAVPSCAPPQPGEALYFGEDGRELITSLLAAVDRPRKQVVLSYPALQA